MATILVVDDEVSIQQLIRFNLERMGYEVLVAGDGFKALAVAQEGGLDLIILDLMLPGLDGFEVLRRLKSTPKTAAIPVVILSAKNEELDKVLGLEMGADDYVTKPFGVRELLARVKACLRRPGAGMVEECEPEIIQVGPLAMDLRERRFYVESRSIELAPKEFELMRYLLLNAGKLVRRNVLLRQIWGYDSGEDTRTLDVHIHHLRRKIALNSSVPVRLETVRQAGYRLLVGLE
ncbi:MAG: response regulator transcription factor [Moorellaceae bacterium]